VTLSFSLGNYDSSRDSTRTIDAAYTQHFTQGTDNRHTTVHYRCNSDPKPEQANLLTSIQEPSPFSYIAEIRTPHACQTHKKDKTGEHGVVDLLEPLSTNCIYLNAGWWLYKYCHLRGLHQLHREQRPVKSASGQPQTQADGTVPSELVTLIEYDLGHFSADISLDQVEKLTRIVEAENVEETYVSLMYMDGTPCEIGGKEKRKTEVRFFCDPNEPHAIENIIESSTCQYVLKVKTKFLCNHEKFLRRQPPIVEISCRPVKKPTSSKQ